MRKGQFFIIGVILLSGIILSAVSLQSGVETTSQLNVLGKTIFEQKIDGFLQTVEIATRQEPRSSHIAMQTANYMEFARQVDSGQGIDSRSYFIIGLPTDSGINISVGNYWRQDLSSISIQVDGETQQFSLPASNITTRQFSTTDRTFRVSVNVTGREYSFTTARKVFILLRVRSSSGSTVWADTVIR
ncbi:MAG: hypothetical protein SVU32_01835 [Candidatus Nanohaloarchaea archaeon]|nr:hypothetical protein [Candidatus Nanohaloarchaea archaeon]